MENKQVYVTIGHDGRGDDYHNEVLYVGTSSEESSEKEFLEDSDFRRVELQVWKGGLHIRTLETDRDRRYTDWTRTYDLETKLKNEALNLEKNLARVEAQLAVINGEGGDDS